MGKVIEEGLMELWMFEKDLRPMKKEPGRSLEKSISGRKRSNGCVEYAQETKWLKHEYWEEYLLKSD